MKNEGVRPSRTVRPARPISVVDFLRTTGGQLPVLVDVREAAAYHARHIAGSIHAPDSQTTALVKKLQALENAVLVCEDGRMSSMVAKTLGFCGFNELAFLEGGIAAWKRAGGSLVETTRSGFEHEISDATPEPAPAAKPGFGVSLLSAILGLR